MATKQEKWKGRIEGAAERCAARGCREPGEFRAPLTPGDFDGPGSWHYLCLEHVRAHNARYNYFTGMTPDEIEAAQSPIAGWERSTRAFATGGADRGTAWRCTRATTYGIRLSRPVARRCRVSPATSARSDRKSVV